MGPREGKPPPASWAGRVSMSSLAKWEERGQGEVWQAPPFQPPRGPRDCRTQGLGYRNVVRWADDGLMVAEFRHVADGAKACFRRQAQMLLQDRRLSRQWPEPARRAAGCGMGFLLKRLYPSAMIRLWIEQSVLWRVSPQADESSLPRARQLIAGTCVIGEIWRGGRCLTKSGERVEAANERWPK